MPYELGRLQRDIAQVQHDEAAFGTGRLVAENLLLTAAHLLWNKDAGAGPFLQDWQVRLERDRGKGVWRFRRGNRVVWHDAARDLALIELVHPVGGPLRPELRFRVATASANNSHSVEARGYPRGSKEMGPKKLVLAAGDLDAVSDDEPLRLGVKTSDLPNNPHQDWPGMSGSVVLLRDPPDPDAIWVFGVVKEVPTNFNGQLRVARLADAWLKEASLRRLLVAAGASDEDPEDPTGQAEDVGALIERLTHSLSLSNAEKAALAADLARIKAELHGTNELVGGFLETMVGRQVSPEQYVATLFRIVADWKMAGERIDALASSQNLSPQLAGMKETAATAHKAGRLDQAMAALVEIDRIESEALAGLAAHEKEVREELRLRRLGNAETKAAQAALSRTRLAYREAAEHYAAAARVVAEADTRAEWGYRLRAADSLVELGVEFGDNQALLEAIMAYRADVLPRAPRDQVPLDWAEAQNGLGTALWRLGEREAGTVRLEEAVTAFREALKERTRDRAPLDWAETQTRLGTTLWRLGEREAGTARLEEAVAAFRAALRERRRDRVPLEWAETQTNLGSAFKTLGERERSAALLEKAVAAFHAALPERTRDRAPLAWAITQNNLGSTLTTLGRWEGGTARLKEGAAAFRAVLQVWTRERVPLLWAMAQHNLGATLLALGERERRTSRLKQAVTILREGLEESTRERAPLQWAATQSSLGHSLWRLGERERGTARLKEAIAAYRAALAEYTREREPLVWAATQNNLGLVLVTLGEREGGNERLEDAVAAYRAALEEYTHDRAPLDWARTQTNLGDALRALAERESGTAHLEQAAAAWEACLRVAESAWPQEWVQNRRSQIDQARAEIVRRAAK